MVSIVSLLGRMPRWEGLYARLSFHEFLEFQGHAVLSVPAFVSVEDFSYKPWVIV
jgi:hypothetical protein